MSPRSSQFSSGPGAHEAYFCLDSRPGAGIEEELRDLLDQYQAEKEACGCEASSEVRLRLHLSDPLSQFPRVQEILSGTPHGFVSVVGQPPAHGNRVSLEAWHIRTRPGAPPARRIHETYATSCSSLFHLVNTTLCHLGSTAIRSESAGEQTKEAFHALACALNGLGANLVHHTLRTWLYIRDIDTRYQEVAEARNEVFTQLGLPPDGPSIASTGIEGSSPVPGAKMGMESLSYLGIRREQVRYMEAEHAMPPTLRYGIRFERGVRILFGDRCHCHISGTASIDRHGGVAHPGDVRAQTRHMIGNVRALLEENDAKLDDLKCATVYLRDRCDIRSVEEEVLHHIPGVPVCFVHAPVCRPGWLVEIEGVAVTDKGEDAFPVFE